MSVSVLLFDKVSKKYDKDFFKTKLPKYSDQYLHDKSTSNTLYEYHVLFDSIFNVEDMFQAFWKHVESEYNLESLEFLVELDKFFKESQTKINWEYLSEIMDLYIKTGGKKELNLSGSTKHSLLSKIKLQLENKEWKLKEKPYHVFEPIRKTILLEFKMGTFPRFVRKNLCQLIVTYLNFDKSVVTIYKNIEFPYKDIDFEIPVVTDKDFGFIKSLSTDTFDWTILKSTQEYISFWCNRSYFQGCSYFSLPCVNRFELVLPHNLAHCAASIMSTKTCEEFDHLINRVTIEETLDADKCKDILEKLDFPPPSGKRSCVITMTDLKLPLYRTLRKLHSTNSIEFDVPTQTLIKVSKTINTKEKSLDKNKLVKAKVHMGKKGDPVEANCYFSVDMTAHMLTKLDDQRTLYKQIHIFSPFGYAQSKLLQVSVAKFVAGPKMYKGYTKYLGTTKEETWEDVYKKLKDDPIGKILEEIDVPQREREYEEKRESMTFQRESSIDKERGTNSNRESSVRFELSKEKETERSFAKEKVEEKILDKKGIDTKEIIVEELLIKAE